MQKLRDTLRSLNIPKRSVTFALAGLIIGISFSYYLKTISLLIVLFCLALAGLCAFKKDKRLLAIYSVFLIIGFSYHSLNRFKKPIYGDSTFSGFVVEVKNNYFLFKAGGVKYYVYEKTTTREIGDFLEISGYSSRYVSTEYESYFSMGEYLAKKGVENKISVKTIETKFQMPLRLRSKELRFLSYFDTNTSGLVDSLLFDHRDYSLSSISLASEIGMLYFLSASGLVYGLILNGVEKLLFLKLDNKKSKIFTLIFGTLFLPFLILKAGVVRVWLTRLLKVLLLHSKDDCKIDHITCVSLVSLLMVFSTPCLALSEGFLVAIFISSGMQLLRGRLGEYKKAKKKVIGVFYGFTFVFPMLISGNALHLFSPLYSTIAIPLVYPFYILSWVSFVTVPFKSVLNFYGSVINEFLFVFSKVDVQIPLGCWSAFLIVGYYTLLLGIYYFKDSGLTNLKNVFLTILSTMTVLNPLPLDIPLTEEVSFINVGQGDSILITSKGNAIMIDTGGNTSFDIATNVLIPFLRKKRIYKIDYLICTHDDEDHIGGKNSLISNYKVKKCIDDYTYFPINIGNLHLTNLNVYEDSWKEENDTSLVIYLEFMNKKWLFMGDAPKEIEEKIIEDNPNLDCDILKVGHHGSKTSSGDSFIEAITPDVGIISVGANNKYGHPNNETIETLSKYNVKIRRTDEEGTITYKRYVSPF